MKNILLLFPFLSIGLFSCNNDTEELNGTVEYRVNCSPGGFSITYENANGNTEQRDIKGSSWSTDFFGEQGDFVYISAQADNENAEVEVYIFYNDKLIESANSSGDYVIATASGTLP